MGMFLKLAWRNLWRNWRRTVIAVIAISLGLAMLLFFDGILGGSTQAMYGNLVKLQGGNIKIHAPGYKEKASRLPLLPLADAEAVVQTALGQPNVIAASRRIVTGGMLGSRAGTFPLTIYGIEPELEAPVGLMASKVSSGRYLTAADEDQVFIGQGLAKQLEVGVGDRVTLTGRATHEQMRSRTMTVVGIYDLGFAEMEKGMVYVSLAEAQALFDLRDLATEVVVSMPTVGKEQPVINALRSALPGYEVDSWITAEAAMQQTLGTKDQVMGLFGLVTLMVAGVGILNLMLMAVFERTREIGVLGALGLKRGETMLLFLLEGLLIGILGVLAGGALGGLIVAYFGRVGMYFGNFGDYSPMVALLGDRVYFDVGLVRVLNRCLTVLAIATLAALYPAWQASRQEPAEALHHV
jgi:ABC-type lipoprotein release transport system permease subunit